MKAGQYATLNKDVGFKKVVYSKKGTNGKRFPCNIKDLEKK